MNPKQSGPKPGRFEPPYPAQHFDPWLIPMYKKVLDCLQLTPRHLLLDAGCGSGIFSCLAIAAGLQVIGVEANPNRLAIARRRNPLNNFMPDKPELLPFADNSFHVVNLLHSFRSSGNIEAAVAEAGRVLKPRGRLVIAGEDKPEMSDSHQIFRLISSLLGKSPASVSNSISVCENDKIETIIEKSGLKLKYKSNVACPLLFANLADGVRCFAGMAPLIAEIHPVNEQIIGSTVKKALKSFKVTDGFYYVRNPMQFFITEK